MTIRGEPGAKQVVVVDGLRIVIAGRTLVSLDRWELRERTRALVLGESGTGKTTFLHVLAGLRAPDNGRVIVDGEDLAVLSETRRDAFRGSRIGYVLQSLHLVKALSVLDNLRLASFLAGKRVPEKELRALLRKVGLEDRGNARTFELSQGEAQRVAIARALVNGPVLVLADEPTSALDDRNARLVIDLLLAVTAEHGAALVVATHDARIVPFFDYRLELGSDR